MRIALGPFCSYRDCCDEGLLDLVVPDDDDAIFCSQEHLDAYLIEGDACRNDKEAIRIPD